jgi:hypothetical protein
MSVGEIDNVFGVPVAVTTKMPQSQAVVLDTKIAVLAFHRTGMEIVFNPYGDWAFQHNAVQYRGETRLTIGVAYPQAINLVSNLNYESGSVWSAGRSVSGVLPREHGSLRFVISTPTTPVQPLMTVEGQTGCHHAAPGPGPWDTPPTPTR